MKRLILISILSIVSAGLVLADTRAEYRAGVQTFYDSGNYETIKPMAAASLYYEFCEGAVVDATAGLTAYRAATGVYVDVSSATPSGTAHVITSSTDNACCQLATELVFRADKYPVIEARVRVLNATGVAYNVGFSDAQSEGGDYLAVQYATTVASSSASDCAIIFYDMDATTDNIYCLAVDSDTDGTVTDTGTAYARNTWHIFRVELNASGLIEFWMDGARVGTQTAGISTDVMLCGYFGFINRQAESARLEIDYIRGWQQR